MKFGVVTINYKQYYEKFIGGYVYGYEAGDIVVIFGEDDVHYYTCNDLSPDGSRTNELIVPKHFIRLIDTD